MSIRDQIAQERARAEAPTPLRKALQDRASTTALLKSARKTHDDTTWGFADHDDPGEEERAIADAWDYTDQEAEEDRPHRPGYHGPNARVAKSGEGKITGKRPAADKPLPKGAHRTPPKGYPKNRDQYADPDGYTYPIDTPEHVRAAIGYFSKPKNAGRYTREEQARMWSRIRRAAKRFGIQMNREDGR